MSEELFSYTRALIDIDSTTGVEGALARHLVASLRSEPHFDAVELWDVEPGRFNVFARRGAPTVVLSTHLDTVPPFFPSREDAHAIYGRGACDAKGIVAAQVFAARLLAAEGASDFGLLFVCGEEKNSAGAKAANRRPQGARFLINGEPTDSRLVEAGKGVLRADISARGRLAHSAYPELGESAIDKLLAALARIRALPLAHHGRLGASTLNIGTLTGGRAPNVVADEAKAELLFRLVEPAASLRAAVAAAAAPDAEAVFVLEIPPIFLRTLPGFATTVVAFGSDVPELSAWGEPLMFGPGSIQVAHTVNEFIAKDELAAAPGRYAEIVRQLQKM